MLTINKFNKKEIKLRWKMMIKYNNKIKKMNRNKKVNYL